MKRDASKFKKTKIIATIGPATKGKIEQLLAAGVNGVRLNFSHGTHAEHKIKLTAARQAAQKLDRSVAIIQDLSGPKIRLGELPGAGVKIAKGSTWHFGYRANFSELQILPTQYDFSKEVQIGEHLYLRDGQIKTVITKQAGGIVSVKALNTGTIMSHQGINLPNTIFESSILTPKDREDVGFALREDVDYVALSFVQTAANVRELKSVLKKGGSAAKVIAKIETQPAVHNLEEIIMASDAVMVARGDLGVEIGAENVPIVGRQIIQLAKEHKKPVIMATQMLESMMASTEPSRAEANDISTAVFLGVDAVMLSGETAIGQFPIETVQMMKKIILKSEEFDQTLPLNRPQTKDNINRSSEGTRVGKAILQQSSISLAAITLAEQLGAKLILAETLTGSTALSIASLRPRKPILMASPDMTVCNQLSIVWGGKSFLVSKQREISRPILNELKRRGNVKTGDLIVSAFGKQHSTAGGTDTIRVLVV